MKLQSHQRRMTFVKIILFTPHSQKDSRDRWQNEYERIIHCNYEIANPIKYVHSCNMQDKRIILVSPWSYKRWPKRLFPVSLLHPPVFPKHKNINLVTNSHVKLQAYNSKAIKLKIFDYHYGLSFTHSSHIFLNTIIPVKIALLQTACFEEI